MQSATPTGQRFDIVEWQPCFVSGLSFGASGATSTSALPDYCSRLGIGVALYVLQDVRTKLDQPGIGAAFTAFLEPSNGKSANVIGEGAILGASASDTTEAHWTLTAHPKS